MRCDCQSQPAIGRPYSNDQGNRLAILLELHRPSNGNIYLCYISPIAALISERFTTILAACLSIGYSLVCASLPECRKATSLLVLSFDSYFCLFFGSICCSKLHRDSASLERARNLLQRGFAIMYITPDLRRPGPASTFPISAPVASWAVCEHAKESTRWQDDLITTCYIAIQG